ncbi:MAG TPA: hypothetical protein VNC22_23375 [Sporichthya sp.]|jgi:hypothetical protein|nr:hypothetical protein [Sporichthya sp.]
MRKRTIATGAGALLFTALAACAGPQIGQPANCGQTTDGTAIVALGADATSCTRLPGQKLVIVDEKCGPLMPDSIVADDCYRGTTPADASGNRKYGNFRLGSLDRTYGATFVASDATAA